MKKYIVIILLLITSIFISCDETETPDDNSKFEYQTITGTIQKGPFSAGTSVAIQELNSVLTPTGNVFYPLNGVDNKGNFEFRTTGLESNYIMANATGTYYNEISGESTTTPITLRVFSDISDKPTMNINVLSHLESERIDYLVYDLGKSFSDAKAQAEQEVLAIFGITEEIPEAELLNISENGILLAISSIIQGYRTVNEVETLLNDIRADLKTDGVLTDLSIGSDLISQAVYLDTVSIALNLESIDINVPFFGKYIKDFVEYGEYIINDTLLISYPESSSGNQNILFGINNIAVNVAHCMAVDTKIDLKIRLTRVSGYVNETWNIAGSNGITNIQGILTDDNNYQYQEFKTTKNGLNYITIIFPYAGSIRIDYFINNELTPSHTKTITVI